MENIVFGTNLSANVNETQLCTYCGTPLWMSINIFSASAAVIGNSLTISAILFSKKLSSLISNYFVFSLAMSDLLVGLSIPYHMCFYIMTNFGKNESNCLFRFVLTAFACASSICNLFFISTDRYIAVVYPLHYSRFVTKRSALIWIAIGWLASFAVAAVPIVWNDWREGVKCEMINVLPNNYLKYIVTPVFVLIWVMMFVLYLRICKEASGQAKRIRNTSCIQNSPLKDTKSFQVIFLILGCFTVCWLPYFVVTVYARSTKYKSPTLYEIFFNLAVANSTMNPLIYAWKNANFRSAFIYLVKCHRSNGTNSSNYVTNYVPSQRNSMNGISNNACQGNMHSDTMEMRICHMQNLNRNENNSTRLAPEVKGQTVFYIS